MGKKFKMLKMLILGYKILFKKILSINKCFLK